MTLELQIIQLLAEVVALGGLRDRMAADTPLLGAVPGLDSMAVMSLVERIEDHFGIGIGDEELDGELFSTVGRLADFVRTKTMT